MVLESLVSPFAAEKKPWHMLIYGFVYSSVAIILSLLVFKDQSSMLMVFLTVLACVPLIYSTIKYEEKMDEESKEQGISLMKGHWRALSFFMYLFLGFIISYSLWFILLPTSLVQTLFSTQISTIGMINSKVTGHVTSLTFLSEIISNNMRVLLFCVFFSFFYGAGAIFILTWNASVISAAVGTFFRNNIAKYASAVGVTKVTGYFHIMSLGILRYMTHGFFEILAYFIGGLAGGLISVAIVNHNMKDPKFKKVMLDALNLLILAIIIVIVAGLIEVFITPRLFL